MARLLERLVGLARSGGRGAVSRAADGIRHLALAPASGEPVESAAVSDRARLGVVLQAAGLISLCEIAGWRLAEGLRGARVDGGGRLNGLRAEPGRSARPPCEELTRLLRALFRAGEDGIAGRGEARRAARELERRWRHSLDRVSADRVVADLVGVAPWLLELAAARDGRAGVVVRDGVEIPWSAGPAAHTGVQGACPLELLARGRFAAAVRAFRERPPADDDERLAQARALAGAGRFEAAMAALGGRADVAAETLRAECLLVTGELSAAREVVRRLEAGDLSPAELLVAADVALRVLKLVGEPERARDWAARALAGARGAERVRARLLQALAAGDRGDLVAMERTLAEVESAELRVELAPLLHEARTQLGLAHLDGRSAVEHATRKLALARRRMTRVEAGRAWSNLGVGRMLERRFSAAERAFGHAARLLRGCDGPLAVTLAGANLADVRLRLGKLDGVEGLLEASRLENRRAGNAAGLEEDELVGVRLELVRFEPEAALSRLDQLAATSAPRGEDRVAARRAAYAARALGWLGRPAAARAALARVGAEGLEELEPEEWPFLYALAGDTDGALAVAARSPWEALAVPLVRGESPPAARWRALEALEPFRAARFVLDAELVAPGTAPAERRERAAALFRRLGAPRAAEAVERSRAVAWRALSDYFEKPSGDRAAIEMLFAAVGHAEAELVLRGPDGERRLAGRGGRELPAERSCAFGEATLVLRAAEFDEPLRALFALMRRETPAAESAPAASSQSGEFLGESPVLRAAIDRLRRFAGSELPVLILGENGTGKELAARLVHAASARAGAPRVAVNCAGLAEALLLSELFGHARGAYTGADRERAGYFEAARGGTIFLDEIGDFAAGAQGSLLRVLQEKEIRRLGESLARRVDVRVVAATNRDLESMVEQGKFRQDLYFRLKAATVTLPPLRERGNDVLLLAEHALAGLRARRPELKLTPEARRALLAHAWPGNVRELLHVLEAAAMLCEDGRIAPEHLDLGTAPPPVKGSRPGDYHVETEAFRRRLIESALAACAGNLAAAARKLGVSRQFLSQFVRKYGIRVRP